MFTGRVKVLIPRSRISVLPQLEAFTNPEFACGLFEFMRKNIIRWLISFLN